MLTSSTKLLAVLTLCSTATLGACAMDDANSSEGEQVSIVNPDGIIVNLSVTQWQTDLRAWQMDRACRPSVTVDGVFGPMTTAATECFQRHCGLTADGVVGNDTLDVMCGSLLFINRTDLFNASHCPVNKPLPLCL